MVRIILFTGTLVSLWFVPWTILRAWLAPLPDTVQEQVQDALAHGFDGIIVCVNQPNQPPLTYTAGWHNRHEKIPARADALFKIASIGKLYDAVAITRLVHTQRLSLDRSLSAYFPELMGRIQYADKITLRMLVQHRSGIPSFTDTPDFWMNPPKSSEETLNRVLDLPANFEPDQDYQYSNTNYLLLSLLIEKVTGDSRFQYIKKEILNPMGLHDTFGSLSEVDIRDVMSGYYVGVEEDIKTTDYGSMLATAADVSVFLRALNDGSIFADGEQEIYTELYTYNHTGLIPGYQSIASYHPDIDAVVIQFVNTTDFDGYHWSLSEIVYDRIVDLLRRGAS